MINNQTKHITSVHTKFQALKHKNLLIKIQKGSPKHSDETRNFLHKAANQSYKVYLNKQKIKFTKYLKLEFSATRKCFNIWQKQKNSVNESEQLLPLLFSVAY